MDMFRPQRSVARGALDSFAKFVHGDAVGMK
jgi:hypothetical protein